MAFPTNLKDEIKADGITAKQYKQIDVISGASLNGGNPIVLQRYDKPKQQGSVLNAKMVNAIHQRLNELDGAVVTDAKHVTRIGADLVFENDITIKAGSENILYYMVGDVGHLMIHGGNIGNSTAGYAYSLAGYSLIKLAYVSGQAYSINSEKTYAWLNIPVGAQFVGCSAIICPCIIPGSVYTQLYSASAGGVDNNGMLSIEARGFGFIPAHTFSFQVLLYRV